MISVSYRFLNFMYEMAPPASGGDFKPIKQTGLQPIVTKENAYLFKPTQTATDRAAAQATKRDVWRSRPSNAMYSGEEIQDKGIAINEEICWTSKFLKKVKK